MGSPTVGFKIGIFRNCDFMASRSYLGDTPKGVRRSRGLIPYNHLATPPWCEHAALMSLLKL
jgi:hypothetical protein